LAELFVQKRRIVLDGKRPWRADCRQTSLKLCPFNADTYVITSHLYPNDLSVVGKSKQAVQMPALLIGI